MFYHSIRARISNAGALTHGFANRRAYILTLLFRREAGTQQTFSSSPFTATDRCICRADIVEMGRDPAVISKSFCVGALRGTYHYPDVFVRPVSRQPSVLILRASLAKTLCSHTCPLMIISGFACRIGRRSNQ